MDGTQVDPRACGVDMKEERLVKKAMGGSPRMRGRRIVCDNEVIALRWIPAHAG